MCECSGHFLLIGSDYTARHWLERQRNYLTSLELHDCDYYCFWAHRRVGLFKPEQQRRNLDDSIIADVAKFYKVSYKNRKDEEYIAIRCRIEPEMYLRLGNKNMKEMVAMVKEESKVISQEV